MSLLNKFLILLLFLLVVASGSAQDRQQLEKKRKKLLEDIQYTNKLLEKTKETKASSLSELLTLQQKIKMRESLIGHIAEEIAVLQDNIEETEMVIQSLEKDLKAIKEEYAKMIRAAYKHHSAYDRLLFIFSSKSFNDAYKRMKYFKRYSEYRKKQAELIKETQEALAGKIEQMEEQKNEKQALLRAEQQQRGELSNEKENKNQLVQELQKKERQLLAELKEKQKTADRLNKAIEDAIKKEIEEAKRKAAAEAAKTGKPALSSTPEAAALSANFENNKGKLPWPVERGVIAGTFGEHPHPVLKGVKTTNNGVDIKTEENSVVRALFEGTVVNIVFNPGFQKAVIVRHGEYFTVYSNLRETYVKPGDKLTTKQPIGVVHTSDKTEVHLEIWKGTTKLDPALWIFNQ